MLPIKIISYFFFSLFIFFAAIKLNTQQGSLTKAKYEEKISSNCKTATTKTTIIVITKIYKKNNHEGTVGLRTNNVNNTNSKF